MDIYSRFLYQDGQYKKNPPRIKHTAFHVVNGQVSVYQTDALNDPAIWSIATSLNPNRRVHGRGDVTREDIESVELNIMIEEPPPLHRNIVGWPNEELQQLSKAQELATKAKLILA
jgi:hypothetical protein